MDDAHRELLDRYVDAFERYDMESLTSLLHEDATLSMPPYELWMRGHAEHPRVDARDRREVSRLAPRAHVGERLARVRAVPVERSGRRPRAVGARRSSRVSDGQIVGINSFLDTANLFPMFGLPERLAA